LVESSNKTDVAVEEEGCPATQNIQCKDGVMLPAWITPGNDSGKGWVAVKAFVYFVVMFILFLGISIISDRFMAAIEVITSQEKEITIKDKTSGKKHIVTVKIWNETVANLSLMALGSSAPEILLSVIEIIGRGFVAGELGPSTIVGSAAFNLFMITAVCVSVLPEGEVRRIKHLNVFAFTATCSVFAYVWMYIILAVSSPGVIEIWEGVITLICFPGMVGIAWMIDCNINFYRYLRKRVRKTKKGGHHIIQSGDGDVVGLSVRDGDMEKNHIDDANYDAKEIELLAFKEGDDPEAHMKEKKRLAMEAYRKAKEKYPDADSETLQQLVEAENRKMQHKSRAYYRIQAVRNMTGQGAIFKKPDQAAIQQKIEESQKEAEVVVHEDGIYFFPGEYTVVESCGTCYITVNRYGPSLNEHVEVDYETLDGSAVSGDDYESATGTLTFSPGETEKTIPITINDDDVFELDEHFYCKLTNVRSKNTTRSEAALGTNHTATITILDDDYPGVFTIENARYEVMETVGVLTVRIIRLIGARGVVRIPYHTESGSAKGGGEDFEDCVGEVEFPNEEFVKDIEILIVDKEEYEKDKTFHVVLGEPVVIQVEEAKIANIDSIEDEGLRKILEAGKPALGENKSAEVHIVECQEFKNTIDTMLGKANMASFLKSSSWYEQFVEAFQVSAGDDDDDDSDEEVEPSYYDYLMHYLSLIWKVLFAFVPPTDIWGGWACFWTSISMIGILTAITGDVASHFGCTIGLADSVVAISFVALGTSLPDTFASKVATINDETADSSIGNVTGSNSVNVFLGIGLAWLVAAVYHTANGSQFEVEPGSLGFSVLIFCIEALVCIGLMMFRRFHPNIGAELGGPKNWRIFTSTFCACLWLCYVLLSSLQTYCHIRVSF